MNKETVKALQADHSSRWKNREEIAQRMIAIIGRLYREKDIIVTVYGHSLVNKSVIQILKIHRRVRMIDGDLSVVNTMPLVEALANMSHVSACAIDVGRLALELKASASEPIAALEKNIAELNGAVATSHPRDVVLYGFGRIGRMVARLLIGQTGSGRGLQIRAIVVRQSSASAEDLSKRASLLRRDSVHGQFEGTISVDEENQAIIANGVYIQVIYANNPADIDYTQYGIEDAIVIDNTGKWRDQAGLMAHSRCPGVQKVVLTAPSKGEMKNIVYGVNHSDISTDDVVISAASCTTNAITPILKVIHDHYGIETGHVETIHSFTNDQNLIDNYHSADRRGRAATLNMVITETGAAKAVAKALPELKGKLTGNSVRVPTPNVSLAILNLSLQKASTRDDVNEFIRQVSINSNLQHQIEYTNSSEVVSSDFIGSLSTGIFDAQATIVTGTHATLYVWYDNEVGYSAQVIRIAQQLAGVFYPEVPVAHIQA